ncbi:UxaA family hydrolase [Bacillus halotolerans]|uniref:UxaA family hydrolase n=1 Tax=Bacillus halotolerans TaxID=260554 RepID=UPI00192A7B90|nr:altronate dehydratase family protein [Bacillus halotolerans]MBL4968120.1 altronate dehydratase [Bacillus halotolerans]MBL4972181.1 altronate dehydratase [Bacillus halotolerans]MEC0251217.1 altronate dehydratase family protein [Bacillus halotolerans]MEC0358453.1 altronate dehydratase family protein [Bacillus halotolerans]
MKSFIKIHRQDNVLLALRDIQKGERLNADGISIEVKDDMKRGHKIALQHIKENDSIIKYGFPIGHALKDICIGEHIHVHNTKTNLSDIQTYSYTPRFEQNPYTHEDRTFKGYRRENGNAGVRNELWIVPTVGCVNGIAEKMLQRFVRETGDIVPFDNVLVLKHQYGCSQLGDDHENTRQILLNAIRHPNAGGVLVLGLGCENNELAAMKKALQDVNKDRVKFLESQSVTDEMEAGVALLKDIHEAAKGDKREDIPLSELKIGLKCGGSDGFSGITANPLLGRFSDYIIAQGGSTVLTEVPEMFGAETLLMQRAANEEVFHKIVDLINDFKQYFIQHDQPVYENPSPGNKAGGISTLEDKSLGCTQKAGISPVSDVLKYGEVLQTNGLTLLSAPGNDLIASSALAAAGCHIVLFTTGRGTPFGTFVPTVKVATNTQLYETKPHWIDFNAGLLVEDDVHEEFVLREFIDYITKVASGELVNHEKNDFRELAIFKSGVTL